MKPKDQFTLDAAVLVGLTFVAAAVVFGLTYYFFFEIIRTRLLSVGHGSCESDGNPCRATSKVLLRGDNPEPYSSSAMRRQFGLALIIIEVVASRMRSMERKSSCSATTNLTAR